MYDTNYYSVLGISYPSSPDEIKTAYHTLAKKEHPDMGGDVQKMKLINRAYEVRGDPAEKEKYDAWLTGKTQQSNNTSSDSNHSQQQTMRCIVHILTIEGKIVTQYVDIDKFKFDYWKYFDENKHLYFYEVREGSKISTVVTYKDTWYEMMYKARPDKKAKTSIFSIISNIFGYIKLGFYIVIILLPIILFLWPSSNNNENERNYTNTSVATPTPVPLPAEPLPENGQIFKQPAYERIAPLTIRTEDSSSNYYIFLKHISEDRSHDMSFFVHAGNSLEIDVPLGTYKLFYCSGTTWYGTEHRFGYDTPYCTSDELLEFSADDEYVYGHTLTLYPVLDGNFETEYIDESEFPE